MKLSGTPEEILQGLADLITRQSEEHSELLDKVLAMDSVLRGVAVHLIGSELVTPEKWNDLLTSFAGSIVAQTSDVEGMSKSEADFRASRVSSEILAFQFDENTPPHLTVIKGGIEG